MSELFEKKITAEDKQKLLGVGFDPEERERQGTFTLLDHQPLDAKITGKGVELLPLAEAIGLYPQLTEEYLWTLVQRDKDEYTEEVHGADPAGYFIRVRQGHQAVLPLQACFFIKADRFRQKVHNLIVMEEDSSLNIINGCASANYVRSGVHIGVTEIYVKKNASLSYTMIHDWSESVEVRPRTAIRVEDSGSFVSNYISIKQSKITQMFPVCQLRGNNSTGIFNSLIYAPEGSVYDLGAKVLLSGKGSKAEVISRAISGGGKMIARGELVGEKKGIKAHLECSGMLLNSRGSIQAIPILEARHPDVDMSHEASVGKIAEEEVHYLMSRGISEEMAISLIVRGFLDTKILGLPSFLEKEVKKTLDMLQNAI